MVLRLSHLSCYYHERGAKTAPYAFTVTNPELRPGGLLAAVASGPESRLSGQLACRLAVEEFVEAGGRLYSPTAGPGRVLGIQGSDPIERGRNLVACSFKAANQRVVEFAERMAAGGRAASGLLGLVFSEGAVAAGRVGVSGAYLLREGEIFPFFAAHAASDGVSADVGRAREVHIEIASLELQAYDVIFVSSADVPVSLARAAAETRLFYRTLSTELRAVQSELIESMVAREPNVSFFLSIAVGPPAVYLPSYARLPSW